MTLDQNPQKLQLRSFYIIQSLNHVLLNTETRQKKKVVPMSDTPNGPLWQKSGNHMLGLNQYNWLAYKYAVMSQNSIISNYLPSWFSEKKDTFGQNTNVVQDFPIVIVAHAWKMLGVYITPPTLTISMVKYVVDADEMFFFPPQLLKMALSSHAHW